MATFVYAPAIRVHVETEEHGILDISEDITQWELVRRTNAPSSFNFMLQNTQRKYDRVFRPQDRITVSLKRIVWLPVFTGSLNNVPIFSAWPRALPLSATCSLKKLQFWPWDPTTNESSQMIQGFVSKMSSNTTAGDAGLSGLIKESMVNVTGWNPQAIHIGAIPNSWFKWAQQTEQLIDAASNMQSVLGPGTVGSPVGNLSLPAGHYGGAGQFSSTNLDKDQARIATIVYVTTIGQAGLKTVADQDRAALLALMAAGDESRYRNLDVKVDHTSLGVFQQQDGWGNATQRLDVQWATLAFLKGSQGNPGLLDQSDWRTGRPGLVVQHVQKSYDNTGNNYTAWQGIANDIVKALRAQVNKKISGAGGTNSLGTGVSSVDPTGTPQTGRTNYQGTGDAMAKVAYDLVHSRPAGTIWYSQERGTKASDPRSDNPTRLDCSSLVEWVYYHVSGTVWGKGNTYSQYPACKVRDIPMDIAKYIRGCLLFGNGGNNGSFSTPDHVGIAIGDGKTHIAAHDVTPGHIHDVDQSDLPGGLYSGALHPDIDYTQAATTEKARSWLQSHLNVKCSISKIKLGDIVDPSVSGSAYGLDGGTTDPFAQLVSVLTINPAFNGDIFGGSRQLMNNRPFLPWLGNLVNSSMRAYCSAPNGDFMAWFPDYFNVWGTAAIMDLKLIELQDFTVDWSDQEMVTHEFVVGSVLPAFDQASGAIVDNSPASWQGLQGMLATEGIATMDFPEIFKTIYGKPASGHFASEFLKRFGARPNVEAMPNIIHGPQEFYMALWLFMKHWAEQFNASVPMTFMPELWPGMIIRIQEYGFQAYVSEVTHRGTYGSGGGFTTQAKIIAPAPIDENLRGSLFGMLDVFGDPSKKRRKKR